MARKSRFAFLPLLLLATTSFAQDTKRSRIDVDSYVIDAEINPRSQTLTATAQVKFAPLDDTSSASFELNNALNVSRVVDATGRAIPTSRSQQDFRLNLSFPEQLGKTKPASLTFTYDGKLTGQEESPVYGIKFASIQADHAFLMYPARWFPVNDYTSDRYTAEMRITVPTGFKVLASGTEEQPTSSNGDKVTYRFVFNKASFPGSIAVVQGQALKTNTEGVAANVYFRNSKDMASAYGTEAGKVLSYLTSVYGVAPQSSLTLVETESGTPNGYAGPGILFLSPSGIGKAPNSRLLANQIARQWWNILTSPATRNHMWLQNGGARYAELLYIEHLNGSGALESEVRDTNVEALTVDTVPLIQSARLEDYSPEYWAATAGKGAAVMHMLRGIIGDSNLEKVYKTVMQQYAWKSITTNEFRDVVEKVIGSKLDWFFLQWIESSGAPEFKMEYTVFRTTKGFRVMGKVAQDLDLFRMPVDLKIETEGNPEDKKIEVSGTSSEFTVETFGKPKKLTLDPNNHVLRFSNPIRVAVAIRRGEQFAEVGEYSEALKEYQKALDVNRTSSLAHFRVGQVFMLQGNYQSAANSFREALQGDFEPKWTEVWSHINLGKIFDITSQRERAVNEYTQAVRTKDNSQNAQDEASKYLKQPYERPRTSN